MPGVGGEPLRQQRLVLRRGVAGVIPQPGPLPFRQAVPGGLHDLVRGHVIRVAVTAVRREGQHDLRLVTLHGVAGHRNQGFSRLVFQVLVRECVLLMHGQTDDLQARRQFDLTHPGEFLRAVAQPQRAARLAVRQGDESAHVPLFQVRHEGARSAVHFIIRMRNDQQEFHAQQHNAPPQGKAECC